MSVKIRLDTGTQAMKFAEIASKSTGYVYITDNNGLRVNGKSVLGALHAMEFSEIWCETEQEMYSAIKEFVVE